MKNPIEKPNEEALLNAFKIEELEERLETCPWDHKGKGLDGDPAYVNRSVVNPDPRHLHHGYFTP